MFLPDIVWHMVIELSRFSPKGHGVWTKVEYGDDDRECSSVEHGIVAMRVWWFWCFDQGGARSSDHCGSV